MKNELAALLPRLEGGEASREMDLAIAQAMVPDVIVARLSEPSGQFTHWRYTTYLDAALALAERVLPGWAWMVRGSHYDGDEASRARVWQPYANPPAGDFDALSPTPALALCAAIVKAKIGEVG